MRRGSGYFWTWHCILGKVCHRAASSNFYFPNWNKFGFVSAMPFKHRGCRWVTCPFPFPSNPRWMAAIKERCFIIASTKWIIRAWSPACRTRKMWDAEGCGGPSIREAALGGCPFVAVLIPVVLQWWIKQKWIEICTNGGKEWGSLH